MSAGGGYLWAVKAKRRNEGRRDFPPLHCSAPLLAKEATAPLVMLNRAVWLLHSASACQRTRFFCDPSKMKTEATIGCSKATRNK